MKTLVLSLKQYHACYYWLYEKGMTRAMVGLQGLHSGDAFRCSNVSFQCGAKIILPLVFQVGGNTEMIATHLREVHYMMGCYMQPL